MKKDNEKCDRGDCETCYPQYYYDEETDRVLVRVEKLNEKARKKYEASKLKEDEKTWDRFANSAWLLSRIYPEIEESDIWSLLVQKGLILEEKGK
jgi:hypothetical protein